MTDNVKTGDLVRVWPCYAEGGDLIGRVILISQDGRSLIVDFTWDFGDVALDEDLSDVDFNLVDFDERSETTFNRTIHGLFNTIIVLLSWEQGSPLLLYRNTENDRLWIDVVDPKQRQYRIEEACG